LIMSLASRMNDIGFLRIKKAIQNKTYEEYTGQSSQPPAKPVSDVPQNQQK